MSAEKYDLDRQSEMVDARRGGYKEAETKYQEQIRRTETKYQEQIRRLEEENRRLRGERK
jgi:hypothetical protein